MTAPASGDTPADRAAEEVELAVWFGLMPPGSRAGRFRDVARQAVAEARGPEQPPVGTGAGSVPGVRGGRGAEPTAGVDPRLAGLRDWPDLEAFTTAFARGREPERESGAVQVTARSLVTGERCPRCGHSFRLGEEVVVRGLENDVLVAQHAAGCPSAAVRASPREREVQRTFTEVLKTLFPSEGGGRPTRLTAACMGLGEEYDPRRRHCMLCKHTLRIGERVVLCPCGRDPGDCGNPLHDDPARGLNCLQVWRTMDKWWMRCRNPLRPEDGR